MRALLASPLGFRIGLVLGSLGGGGSIIAVAVAGASLVVLSLAMITTHVQAVI